MCEDEAQVRACHGKGQDLRQFKKSTFFPDNWNEAKVLDEVEYAIQNNQGRYTSGTSSEYFGLSSDGKIEIHFYLSSDGQILSYFPFKTP